MDAPLNEPVDELIEVVALDGTVERVVPRSQMRAERLRHRATFIAVVDSAGRLLIHQRSPHKDVWPLRWDIAAGGCAAVGESWDHGAARELEEELGLVVPLERIGDGAFEDDDVAVLGVIYLARSDGPVQFSDGEVVDARWVTRSELDDLVRTETFCPDSLALVLPAVQLLLA